MTRRPHVIIHTDGACSGNPGPGGWGAILHFGEHEKELKGGEAHTTNNRMELMAAIAALEALKQPCDGRAAHRQQVCARRHLEVDPRLEAQRLEDRRQEAGEERRPVAAARRRARSSHEVHWHWVKGHAGHELNERADQLARRGHRGHARGAEIKTLSPLARREGSPSSDEDSEALQQIVGAGDVGLAGRVLDVERLHHAVLDHHRIAPRTHAEAALGQVRA